MKISEEEQRQRKTNIIHSAFRLFSQNGIDGVTLRVVAREAGVSEASIYRYFATKTDLVVKTVAVLWKEITVEMTQHIDESIYVEKSGLEQLQILLDGFHVLMEEKMDYIILSYEYKLYLIRQGVILPEDKMPEVLVPIQQRYQSALEKGMADGTIRPLSSADDLYWVIWGMMRGYVAKIALYESPMV